MKCSIGNKAKKKKLTALRVHKLSPTSLLTELSGLYLPRSDEMGIVALDVAVNIKNCCVAFFIFTIAIVVKIAIFAIISTGSVFCVSFICSVSNC